MAIVKVTLTPKHSKNNSLLAESSSAFFEKLSKLSARGGKPLPAVAELSTAILGG
ncbi:hypothetical protein GJ699_25170 [Duganella sp. FT80W]|uniref:Uncharacterized protein n=1 Tax=Duganella guangzhouensis TaxID=2666084 RepID=A0A6I2L8X4_9BURK|nr:hypothetical protein [Duganella guangzhouensis]MRW93284.1 hypothetical protein [Duganella guangzhouensis]